VKIKRLWNPITQVVVATALILSFAYFDLGDFLPFTRFWIRIIETTLSTGISLFFIHRYAPNAMQVLRLPRIAPRFIIALFFTIFICANLLGGMKVHEKTIGGWIAGIIAALCVGITEEFFCRGFLLGMFSRLGIWLSALFSSLFFGLLHFINIAAGQGWGPTTGQVISASGFGFFAAGLTLFSRSIYLAVIIHAAVDLPVMLSNRTHYAKVLTKGELVGSLHLALWWGVLGLIFIVGTYRFHKLEPLLIKWKLVEIDRNSSN
jgi:membrane protease YdiL (CAAX protease family)